MSIKKLKIITILLLIINIVLYIILTKDFLRGLYYCSLFGIAYIIGRLTRKWIRRKEIKYSRNLIYPELIKDNKNFYS